MTRPWMALFASMKVADLEGDCRYVDRRDLTKLEGFRKKYGTKEDFLRLTPVFAAEIFQEMVRSHGSSSKSFPFPRGRRTHGIVLVAMDFSGFPLPTTRRACLSPLLLILILLPGAPQGWRARGCGSRLSTGYSPVRSCTLPEGNCRPPAWLFVLVPPLANWLPPLSTEVRGLAGSIRGHSRQLLANPVSVHRDVFQSLQTRSFRFAAQPHSALPSRLKHRYGNNSAEGV